MSTQAGYSKTPLSKKLGFKPGLTVQIINAPDHYFDLFEKLPEDIVFTKDNNRKKDLIHYFVKTADELAASLPGLQAQLKQDGMLWISWPKKSSGLASDLNGNGVRTLGLAQGLVDIKVCAVDETWSGLKFVIPVKDRIK